MNQYTQTRGKFRILLGKSEHFNNSQDLSDIDANQLEKKKQEQNKLIDDNNDLIDNIEGLETEKGQLEVKIRELQEQKDALENEREVIEEKLPLKERIKQIIKRHGLTITGIALAVGTIIGVIINSLQSGLSAVAKGVGSGLKSLGAKLAAILPGMIGAIASFIFKTAGEVVGFLGKHAWVLIVGVVVLMVSQLKKRINKK